MLLLVFYCMNHGIETLIVMGAMIELAITESTKLQLQITHFLHASIDGNVLSIEVGAGWRQQETDHCGDFIGLAHALEPDLGHDASHGLGRNVPGHVGFDVAWRDGVEGDGRVSELAHLTAHGARKGGNPGLGRSVRGLSRVALLSNHRAHTHDAEVRGCRGATGVKFWLRWRRRRELAQKALGEEHRAGDVGVECLVDGVLGTAQEQAVFADARCIDKQ